MSHRRFVLSGALVLAAVTAASCASPGSQREPQQAGATASTVTLAVPSGRGGAPFDQRRTVVVPAGWKMSVWARLDAPRLALWTPDRRMLVSRPGHGDVVSLSGLTASAPVQKTLISGLRQPHGLAMRGSTLYVAESNRVDTYTYSNGSVGPRQTLIDGLPDSSTPELGGQYAHALKSVAVAADGTVYVSVGSTGNVSVNDRTASPERATILRWSPATRKLDVFARGVRNGTGLAIDPAGAVWTAVNNRDQIAYPFNYDYDGDGSNDYGKVMQSYVNGHPMEALAKLTPGRDLGWPYCQPNPDVNPGKRTTAFDYSNRNFHRDMQLNPTGSKLDCAKLPALEAGFPAHSAPLGLSFATVSGLGSVALVGTHGSWNRNPPRKPTVTSFTWANGKLGEARTLVMGFQNADGSRWGRPVAAVRGADGAIYITDDAADAVYRLARA